MISIKRDGVRAKERLAESREFPNSAQEVDNKLFFWRLVSAILVLVLIAGVFSG